MVAFHYDALTFTWEYPIDCIRLEPKAVKFSEDVTHRDYLGAILNLGVDRSVVGDICLLYTSTPENTAAVEEALAARELIKISVLQNCLEDPREMAQVLAERTRSQVVQVIGKKIVLYREGKKDKKKIILP